jgi:hypothetical protein
VRPSPRPSLQPPPLVPLPVMVMVLVQVLATIDPVRAQMRVRVSQRTTLPIRTTRSARSLMRLLASPSLVRATSTTARDRRPSRKPPKRRRPGTKAFSAASPRTSRGTSMPTERNAARHRTSPTLRRIVATTRPHCSQSRLLAARIGSIASAAPSLPHAPSIMPGNCQRRVIADSFNPLCSRRISISITSPT